MTTQFNISEAARIAEVSRNTIKSHMKSGKLSFIPSPSGEKLVDAAELMRVYGDKCDFRRAGSGMEKPATAQVPVNTGQIDHLELVNLKQRLELINEERKREREQLQQQIDHLQKSLEKALDGSNKAMLLLEHRSGGGELEKRFQELEEKLANRTNDELERLRSKAKQEAFKDIKNKYWWQLLGAKT